MAGDWENGICSCFNDCTTCIIVYFCPCYIAGKNAEAVGESCCICGIASMLGIIGFFTHVHVRGKIRDQKGISGSCIGDCCAVFLCQPCALCQEAQEVKSLQGLSMARE